MSAALADGRGEFQEADGGIFVRRAPDHADRVVAAAVEHDDQMEFAG